MERNKETDLEIIRKNLRLAKKAQQSNGRYLKRHRPLHLRRRNFLGSLDVLNDEQLFLQEMVIYIRAVNYTLIIAISFISVSRADGSLWRWVRSTRRSRADLRPRLAGLRRFMGVSACNAGSSCPTIRMTSRSLSHNICRTSRSHAQSSETSYSYLAASHTSCTLPHPKLLFELLNSD